MPPSDNQTEFGAALRSMRSSRGLSQAAVAEGLRGEGVTVTGSAVGEWERGDSEPTRDKVFALEQVLDIAPGDLSQHLGYYPPQPDDDEMEMSASGRDLDELRTLDPDSYEVVKSALDTALDRARRRRTGR